MSSSIIRRIRLASGVLLFSFVLTHLLNHALGLISLEALEAGRSWFLLLWRNPVGGVLLPLALVLHLLLGIWALYERRRLRMPLWQAAQMLLGYAIPPILVIHVLGTGYASRVGGVDDTYLYVLLPNFVNNPSSALRQSLLVVIVWTHGCIGIHYWLRLKSWYQSLRPVAFGTMLLVPTLALLGFWVIIRDLGRLASDPAWREAAMAGLDRLPPDQVARLYIVEDWIVWGVVALIALALMGRGLRAWLSARRGLITLGYPEGRRIQVVPGTTILEASRAAGVPHASVCGGRGRCSTCRVRISSGLEALPPAAEEELRVLSRVGAAPNVRLACQSRPSGDVEVVPLLPATAGPGDAGSRPGYLQGEERDIVILFADLRGFTTLSEKKLPYDVVFVLNRYFAAVGGAVEQAGGHIDKFIGDGVMALFGVSGDPTQAARRALAAARGMAEALDEINRTLSHDLDTPLRIGIGIHGGPVIVGEMGYGLARSITAIGDAVNTASRLEGMTKTFGAQLVVSEPVAARAGIDLGAFPLETAEVRGRNEPLPVRVVADAVDLPGDLAISIEGGAPSGQTLLRSETR